MAIGDHKNTFETYEEVLDHNVLNGYSFLSLISLFHGDFSTAKVYIDTLCALDTNSCRFPLMYYYILTEQFEKFNTEQDDLDLFSLANDIWKSYILIQ